jgi:mannose-6-phosphate isomerase-like protein (cupin superfamily)
MMSAVPEVRSGRRQVVANSETSVTKAIFVPPNGNRSTEPTGDIRIKLSGVDTSGAVAVLEVQTDHDFSTPVHVHHVENESFYAIEGEYEIKVGDEMFHLKPGGNVYAPKLMPHAISQVSPAGGKLIVVVQPAGEIEAFSVDLFKLVSSGTRDGATLKAVFLKHDMDVVGPPLPKSINR